MDSHAPADDGPDQADAVSAWATATLSSLMERHGVPARHQAALVAQVCGLSISQARRKMRGAAWLFGEVIELCRHFGENLGTVFPDADAMQSPPPLAMPAVGESATPSRHAATYPATLLLDGQCMPCEVSLGSARPEGLSPASAAGIVAVHGPEGWIAGSASRLAQEAPPGPRYEVLGVQLNSEPHCPRARIAVLDDDAGSAGALSDWFREVGYEATAFTRCEDLLATRLAEHDAFVLDLMLGNGETSQGVVTRIRQEKPSAPIILLTGQLREGAACESVLTTILRTQDVTFFEKPVRPAVLTASIQSSLDRLALAHG